MTNAEKAVRRGVHTFYAKGADYVLGLWELDTYESDRACCWMQFLQRWSRDAPGEF